jgi:PadR family transcriptional regulator, regulatory protein PadR
MDQPLDVLAFARHINELLVLASLDDEPKHGYQIALDTEARSGGLFVLQHGTLYPVLHRLEAAKLVRSAWQEEGGRRRRVYTLTRAGREELAAHAARCDEVLRGLLSVAGRRGA